MLTFFKVRSQIGRLLYVKRLKLQWSKAAFAFKDFHGTIDIISSERGICILVIKCSTMH